MSRQLRYFINYTVDDEEYIELSTADTKTDLFGKAHKLNSSILNNGVTQ
jgi:hypothetical protein